MDSMAIAAMATLFRRVAMATNLTVRKMASSASRCDIGTRNFIAVSSNSNIQSPPPSPPKERVDCVVIGAGVVGIAVTRQLALKGRQVLVIESAPTFGTGASSRNSEVIHAGIYYSPNSLKARLCVRGRELLYRYCKEHDVPHKQVGKLIVATGSPEIPKLNDLMNRGIENGVDSLRMMEGDDAMRMEPELLCSKALFSPASGIVDSHSLMLSLMGCHPNLDLGGS